MEKMIKAIQNRYEAVWISVWDERPAKLFDGVDQQLSIHIYSGQKNENQKLFITSMHHWHSESRGNIFNNISYYSTEASNRIAQVIPKIENRIEEKILSILKRTPSIQYFSKVHKLDSTIYYRNAGGRYWRLIKSKPSYFKTSKGVGLSSTEKVLKVNSEHSVLLIALYSSNLFYWYWRVVSNCRHLTDREFLAFSIPCFLLEDTVVKERIVDLGIAYEESLEKNSKRQFTTSKDSTTEQDVFKISLSKPIIDEIDKVLAEHYGFTDEELDFIINYDIKYRMGKELEEDV